MDNKPIIKERLAFVLESKRKEKEAGNRKQPNFTTISNLLGYESVKNFQRQLSREYIKAEYLQRISEYLDVSPDYLSGEVDLLDNGEIPTYSTYLFWNKFDNWSKKHTLYDLTVALLKYQGVDPDNYSRYQIINLSLGICGVVNDFINSTPIETPTTKKGTKKQGNTNLDNLLNQKEGK